jgi:hypothetical protein
LNLRLGIPAIIFVPRTLLLASRIFIRPKNKKSPLIQGLPGFNHKLANDARKIWSSSKLIVSSLLSLTENLKLSICNLSDLHDLFFFVAQDFIDLGYVTVGHILNLFFSALQIVFGDFFVLF